MVGRKAGWVLVGWWGRSEGGRPKAGVGGQKVDVAVVAWRHEALEATEA